MYTAVEMVQEERKVAHALVMNHPLEKDSKNGSGGCLSNGI